VVEVYASCKSLSLTTEGRKLVERLRRRRKMILKRMLNVGMMWI
jgi:DNA-binding MarR family transcriptional regulator